MTEFVAKLYILKCCAEKERKFRKKTLCIKFDTYKYIYIHEINLKLCKHFFILLTIIIENSGRRKKLYFASYSFNRYFLYQDYVNFSRIYIFFLFRKLFNMSKDNRE